MLAALRCVQPRVCAARQQLSTMAKKSYYAVAVGRRPGLYKSWEDCSAQVHRFPGSLYQGFASEQEARSYLAGQGVAAAAPRSSVVVPAAAAAAAAAAESAHWGGGSGGGDLPPAAAAAAAAGDFASGELQDAAIAAATTAVADRAAAAGGEANVSGRAEESVQRLPSNSRVLRMEFDGASKRNPGPAGWGAVIYDDATNTEVARLCAYMGSSHTNNQAEYAGLIAGLQAALELGCERIKVQGDSKLVVEQVLGHWQVKNEGLMPYHRLAQQLSARFGTFEARQVMREFNSVADALSNEAIIRHNTGLSTDVWTLEGVANEAAAAAAAVAAPATTEAVSAAAEEGSSQLAAEGASSKKRKTTRSPPAKRKKAAC